MKTQIKVFKGVNDATEDKVNQWLSRHNDDVLDIKVSSVCESKNGNILNYLQYTIIYKS